MAIEYLGLSEINGPLVVLEGVKNASYEEIVSFRMDDGTEKLGRIIEIYEDKAVIQVFEGTDNMSLGNTHTRLSGHPMEIGLSPEILGRTFNGIGQPIDGLGEITPEVSLNINGLPLNPVTREYPRNYINTGISAIDGLTTLIRGQKLPIFSGNGLPHDKLAAQIVRQASLGADSDENFAIVKKVCIFWLSLQILLLSVRQCVRFLPPRERFLLVKVILDIFTVSLLLYMSVQVLFPVVQVLLHRSRF